MLFRRIYCTILLGSLMMLISVSNATAQDVSKYQALFMTKFMEYVQWPEGNDSFVIGVVGNSRVLTELQALIKSKGRDATVKKIANASSVKGCHIVFIPADQAKLFQTIKEASSGTSTMIISETQELAAKGSIITFYVEGGKLKFIINRKEAESRKLLMSSSLLNLAKVI
ncbi:YfiR family protein [Fulvivirga sp. M361]|uniref:YfiR family protein n=1 Tax=Fulvivirga sp. M361 TaxID=2594266 RepID=UPI001179C6B0|nr:YfiR family protein [Fulvivirga sp. M361]TRX53725.1 YfiR family protein [Fulvivirga sp. M361]